MSNKTAKRPADVAKRATMKKIVLSGDEVKTRLREKGLTLKDWAKTNGYPYDTVSAVVRGVNRGTFGMGHRIATALGLK